MNEINETHTKKTGGINVHTVKSKQAMFSKISSRSDEIIEGLFELAFNSRQEAVKMGALKILINKVMPDLREVQIDGNEDKPLQITLDIKGVDPNELHRAGQVPTETVAGV